MQTADQAILLAMRALGGTRSISEVKAWIALNLGLRWTDIGTAMADLTYPGNSSSLYPIGQRFLERVSRGVYRLRPGWLTR